MVIIALNKHTIIGMMHRTLIITHYLVCVGGGGYELFQMKLLNGVVTININP